MENNFENRDFEQFVKQNADQYRMFPSEKVWSGIHTALHTRLRRFGYGIALLLLSSAAITLIMLSNSKKSRTSSTEPVITQQTIAPKTSTTSVTPVIAIQPTTDLGTTHTPSQASTNKFSVANNDFIDPIEEETNSTTTELLAESFADGIRHQIDPELAEDVHSKMSIPVSINITDQATDNNLTHDINPNDRLMASIDGIRNDMNPLGIESVINSFTQTTGKTKRLTWQLFFTPTVSYRKLTENKAYLNTLGSSYPSSSYYDVNSVVKHRPDMGLELGFNAAYRLNSILKVTAGFQFNVSKYDIRAYSYSNEVATIALNTAYGTSSLSTSTTYRNFDGYNQNWLANLYYSVSAPVGVELKLTGDRKTYWGVGGSIQPTYILGDRAYLISTDYKNYAEVPSLMRRWNVSSSFETFAGYSTGKIQWRIGPQVRYQMLSSFKEKYPVKEHLFDFGLKVGVMLNQ